MKPIGKWNGIRHYSRLKDFDMTHIATHIEVSAIYNIKLELIGKNGYSIEVRQHPTNDLRDHGLCDMHENRIILNIPEKLQNTETYALFFNDMELEFSKDQLCLTIANEMRNIFNHIWDKEMPIETYREFLNKTVKWED